MRSWSRATLLSPACSQPQSSNDLPLLPPFLAETKMTTDLIGIRFGKLVVKSLAYVDVRKYWKCDCDCGNETVKRGDFLKSGHTKSCGCQKTRLRHELRHMEASLIKDISGLRFGRLRVIGIDHRLERKNGGGVIFWKCICDCGNETTASGSHLKRENTSSCGCLHRERLLASGTTHGGKWTRLYRIWSAMKERCSRAGHISYKNYGGRGIKVCADWRNSFDAFRRWALAHGYADNLTIDRVDNDGNYEPGNCQWLDRKSVV